MRSTQKKIELAVPHEQSGLENAQELVNNLERWLPDTPDNIKWSMEEPLAPTDIAMAELPRELEDIVGELLDKEEAMTPDVQDVTSSWMDSPRQRGRVGRQRRPHLRHERQRRHRQPAPQPK